MKNLLKQVYTGMNDPVQEVRSASMYTLGEFSNYLQVTPSRIEPSNFESFKIIDYF